ncbi:TPA: 7-cyano-7-deazaguanine synthase QueC [Candidatus Poribacteria bacterium]|nr:7-cyano-7-deazaguanine synthase QueC [Candidatus Poribacteria bacterium]HEX29510.1 7-cyano-7-deazaguanine synthase QueC [Candidatus Poribacteria bacterium]
MRSVVLLSGGLDSTVSFRWAYLETELALALTFDYGQRSVRKEVEAARCICRKHGVEHKVVKLEWLAEITRTALVRRKEELPQLLPSQLDDRDTTERSARAVWVPNRNGVFINVAASFAESLECDLIVVGFNAEEMRTFPDNTPQFVKAVNRSLSFSTLTGVRVISPTQDLTKVEIVRMGRKIGAPLEMVWSCYKGGEEHCWRCESCLRLKRALVEAGSWRWFLERRKSG